MSDLLELTQALGERGDRAVLDNSEIAHLFVNGNRILSMRDIQGIVVDAKETEGGIKAVIRVLEGFKIFHPIHMCFGVLHDEGRQEIKMNVTLENNSHAHFIAHCYFPKARRVQHIMDAVVTLQKGAEMRYSETHYHGPFGGVEVVPRAVIQVGSGSKYYSDFSLLEGLVGVLDIDYSLVGAEDSISELTARVFGHGNDRIRITEKTVLAGQNARSLIKTRVAIEDSASAEVSGITEGAAAGSRGHVDCTEIVKDNAVAKAIPIVNVTHPLAKVTHEAAIGSVDRKQLETLMAHGLPPDEAVNVIVKGLLA